MIYIDQHIPALNFQGVHGHLSPRRTGLARLRVQLPAMPGTNNFPSSNHALTERASAMQANVIHGADFAVHVGHADGLVATGKFFGFVGTGEFGLGRNLDEWHSRPEERFY